MEMDQPGIMVPELYRLKVKITTDHTKIDHHKWDEFVKNHPRGNVFQTPEMFNIYRKCPNLEPFVIMALDCDDNPLGLLVALIQFQYKGMMRKITSRAIIWGGPLIDDSHDEVLGPMLETYEKSMSKRALYTEVRNLWETIDYHDFFILYKYKFSEHLNIHIDLSISEEQLWKNLNSKRRNEIRKAYKNNVNFKLGNSVNELKESYNILKEVYQRAKRPLPEFSFFSLMYERLNGNSKLLNFLAIKDDRIIGCMIAISYKDIIYDYYAGAYKLHYRDHPNDLIPWEVFRWGKNNQYRLFDFGGAGKPDEAYGVRDYKKKYGGDFVNYGRYYKIHRPALYKMAKVGFTIWQRLR